MVVPSKQKYQSLKVKNKVRYYTGFIFILVSILNFFFEFYSPVASIIIWPLGLIMVISAIKWPKETPENIIRIDKGDS